MVVHAIIFVCGPVLTTFIGRAAQASGQEVFDQRCSGCHGVDQAREGPPLRGVFGREAGKVGGFGYSKGLKAAKFRWDKATLDKWLRDPESVIPDTDMSFSLSDDNDRAKVVEYLKTLH